MIVMVQVADLSHKNFKSSRVMRWWLSRLSSRFGAKSSCEHKPKWLPGLLIIVENSPLFSLILELCLELWLPFLNFAGCHLWLYIIFHFSLFLCSYLCDIISKLKLTFLFAVHKLYKLYVVHAFTTASIMLLFVRQFSQSFCKRKTHYLKMPFCTAWLLYFIYLMIGCFCTAVMCQHF